MITFQLETFFKTDNIYNVTRGKIPSTVKIPRELENVIESTENQIAVAIPDDFKIFSILPFSVQYIPEINFIYSEFEDNQLVAKKFVRHFGFGGRYSVYEYKNFITKDIIKNSKIDQTYLDLQSLNLIDQYTESYQVEYQSSEDNKERELYHEDDTKKMKISVDSYNIYSEKEYELSGTLVANFNHDEDQWNGNLFGKLDNYIQDDYYNLYQLMGIEGVDIDEFGFHSN